jgi:hypothetical protein
MVNSLYNVNAKPTDAIKPVTMLRQDGEESLENIDFGALLREPLELHSISRYGLSDKRSGVVSHFGLRRKLEIILWGEDIKLLETELGITITDEYTFAEPIEFFARMYKGRAFKGISQLNGREFKETVQTALPEPVAETDSVKPKYHGETVTILSAVEQKRGNYKVWTLTARADDGFFFHKITAWAEHRKLFTDAGYPKLPERGEPAIQLNAEAVIEYVEGKINDYRITHVFPKTDPAPTITAPVVIEKPVRHVIPVTIELSLEDQIAALYRKQDYTVMDILELVGAAVPPCKPVLVSMVTDDKTTKLPTLAAIESAATGQAEGKVA